MKAAFAEWPSSHLVATGYARAEQTPASMVTRGRGPAWPQTGRAPPKSGCGWPTPPWWNGVVFLRTFRVGAGRAPECRLDGAALADRAGPGVMPPAASSARAARRPRRTEEYITSALLGIVSACQ